MFDFAAELATIPDGGVLRLPAGVHDLAATLVADRHVRLVGEGCGNVASPGPTSMPTVVRWTGGAAPMFRSVGYRTSWSFDGLVLDGAGAATVGVEAVAMAEQTWGDVAVTDCAVGVRLVGQSGEGNCHFNRFGRLNCWRCGVGAELGGDGAANACHNRFGLLMAGFTGAAGVRFGDSDNNHAEMVWCYRVLGDGIGLEFAAGARANYLVHVQAPTAPPSVVARAGTRNSILWLDRENGQPEPTVEAGALLAWNDHRWPPALTAPDQQAVNSSWGVDERDVLRNVRDRLGEVEAILKRARMAGP